VFRGLLHLIPEVAGTNTVRRQSLHQRANPDDAFRVEPVHGFVEEQDWRIAQKRGRDAER